MSCVFCNANALPNPPNLKKYRKLLSEDEVIACNIKTYMDEHFPNILEGVTRIPEVRFYQEGYSNACLEPDLVAGVNMTAPYLTKKKRESSEDEESVAQLFYNWANDHGNSPALVMCSFPFQHYLKKFLSSPIYNFLCNNNLLGETDIICLTKSRGLFICEVKSTADGSARLSEDIKTACFQTGKAKMLFRIRSLNINILFMAIDIFMDTL